MQLNSLDPKKLVKQQIIDRKSWISYKIWQESLENTYHFDQLKQLQKQMFKFKEALDFEDSYQIQSIFCIDDREILFRSNLENQNASIQTFGTPGHFGLDINYYEGVSANPQKLCPPPVEAKHKIVSIKGSKRVNNFFKWFSKKNNTRSMKFEVLHSNFNSDFGFSHEAAAEKLSIIFKSIGLKTFAPLIYIIGHESTTSNNPYFNAYGCGACSGRSGAINATVFARLANDKKVQEILASKYNIKIPVFSHFVAAVHNTTSEVLHFFDAQLIPTDQKVLHDSFLSASQLALKKNSIVRAQDFALIRKSSLKMDYFNELRSRSKSFFEPRPELGHTGNLMCVVGRRQMTKGLNFDRRAFVQSYNYDDDQDGAILNSILGAAVPVCGGINLDYFFSSINSDNIGAGSKLSHNVVGLSGLSHGTEDDLLPGLAEQMVELHQPIRMLFVIEQKLEVVKSLMQKNSDLNSWVTKGWIKLACFCPEAKSCFYFDSGSFQKFDEVLGFAENVDVCGVPSV